ncbi:MBL fold metallo-hydrolase [Stutzerimonas kunmingensis]|uniref:MBL fold metallo-hydrolase n=1 Tax=Stutzerimonas kunmingensis TaxID=1211807 RepID=UPI0028B25EDF|nr:MBL fold metallo-hydrolase [Stutzerimonas kunmingensis]
MLKMKFVGATEGVSGSCTWLQHTESNTQLLVDCGLHQGGARETWFNTQSFPFDPAQIRCVLLTHAHIDHCGLLPRLVREGFSGLVYATRATCELAKLMLLDAARVGEASSTNEVERINWSPVDDDPGFKWGRQIRLAEGLRMAFLRSSHILGACSISIAWKVETDSGEEDKTICFSGDIGCQTDQNPYLPLMKSGQHPFPNSDYLVVEATYGNRIRTQEHKSSEARIKRLAEVIAHTVFDKGGKVLLPAFSLHRSQEVMLDVLCWMRNEKRLASAEAESLGYDSEYPFTATLHAPLSQALTKVYASQLCSRSPNGKFKYLNQQLCERLDLESNGIEELLIELTKQGVYEVSKTSILTMARARHGVSFGSNVVIASAGMCDHGPVVAYLEEWGDDPRNTIILTGYQSAGSKGAELLRKADSGSAPDASNQSAEVVDMSAYYSAHADQQMLLDFVFSTGDFGSSRNATVFINHGVPDSKYALRDSITERAAERKDRDRNITRVRLADARFWDLNIGLAIDE